MTTDEGRKQGTDEPAVQSASSAAPLAPCSAEWSPEWKCDKPQDHEGQHRDPVNGHWFYAPEAPRRAASEQGASDV